MLSLLVAIVLHDTPIEAKLVRVNKIWDNSPHAAFTDLVYWKNQFVCVFRTGKGHVSPDGTIQLLSSGDGALWMPLATLNSDIADLRDPKLAVSHTGELLLFATGAMHDKTKHTHRNFYWQSTNGKNWTRIHEIGEPDSWLWRVTVHPSGLYGWSYGTNKERFIRLHHQRPDSAHLQQPPPMRYEPYTPKLLVDQGYPNETAMVMEGDKAWCLLRRDGKPPIDKGMLGTSTAPFIEWTWREIDQKIGGPAMLRLPGGQFLAVVRLYSPKVRTALCKLDPAKPELKELLTFPSGGDCSYAGMVWHQSKLFVSYYSSHEGKSSIYFAEVEIKQE